MTESWNHREGRDVLSVALLHLFGFFLQEDKHFNNNHAKEIYVWFYFMHTYLPLADIKMVIWKQTRLIDRRRVTYVFTREYVLCMLRMSL